MNIVLKEGEGVRLSMLRILLLDSEMEEDNLRN